LILIALVVSLATVNLTGNVIIRQGFGRQVQVANTIDILNMLNMCKTGGGSLIGSTYVNNLVVGSDNLDTCNEICKIEQGTCTQAYISKSDISGVEAGFVVAPISCSTNFNIARSPELTEQKMLVYCTCCSP